MSDDTQKQTVREQLCNAASGQIVLDFDNTLFLDNSTERFLDALRPRLLAFLIVSCSDWLVQGLSWLGICRYNDHRDFMRVFWCTLCMPWSYLWWRINAPRLGERLVNRALLEPVPTGHTVIVLTYGFHHVIMPLLSGMGPYDFVLVASRFWPSMKNLRRQGKVRALEAHTPQLQLDTALFVTDSEEDHEVVAAIPHSHVLSWDNEAARAFNGLYVPLRYTVQGKYPNSRYFTYQILFEDFFILLLAYTFSWQYIPALWFLFLSLYAIYEIGYYDNDHHAINHETTPTVSIESSAFPLHPRYQPWIYALLFAVIGLVILNPEHLKAPLAAPKEMVSGLGVWFLVLAALYLVFRLFNNLKPGYRVWVFPLLHFLKTFSFMVFVPLTAVGALLLAAQTLSIWVNYAIYRHGGDVDRFNRQAWRMILFFIMVVACLAATPLTLTSIGWGRWTTIVVWGFIRSLERAKRMSILHILASQGRSRKT